METSGTDAFKSKSLLSGCFGKIFTDFFRREGLEIIGRARSNIVTEESLDLVCMFLVNYIWAGIGISWYLWSPLLCQKMSGGPTGHGVGHCTVSPSGEPFNKPTSISFAEFKIYSVRRISGHGPQLKKQVSNTCSLKALLSQGWRKCCRACLYHHIF